MRKLHLLAGAVLLVFALASPRVRAADEVASAGPTIAALEQTYVARKVIYLLGALDTNPNHPALDKTCMAEAEGPYRTCAVMPIPPRCRPATAERRITVFATCQASGTTAIKC
jgi:hypothetical protein